MDASRLYTEEVEGITRPCLPVEDLENGLYIHPGSAVVSMVVTEYAESEPQIAYYVGAQDFMEMQKERDDLRRTLSLLNATLRSVPLAHLMDVFERGAAIRMYALLDGSGFTSAAGKATQAVVDWALSEQKT